MAKKDSPLNLYTEKAFKIILIIAPLVAILSAVLFTAGQFLGWFDINTTGLVIFDASTVVYLVVALWFIRFSVDKGTGEQKPGMVRIGKIFLGILTLVHWNFICYLVPFDEFWAYAPLFLVLSAFFFDTVLVWVEAAGIMVSEIVSWIVLPNEYITRSTGDYAIIKAIELKTVCLLLTLSMICLITKFCNKLLMEELVKISDYDPLTHLLNRRKFDSILNETHENAQKTGGVYSIAVIDIDDFKHVNDTYGHDYGDVVLRRIAGVMSHMIGSNGNVFRWGGEEFVIVYPYVAKELVDECGKILNEVASEQFSPLAGVSIRITLTAGVAQSAGYLTVKEVMEAADANLYKGKNSGKAKVVFE